MYTIAIHTEEEIIKKEKERMEKELVYIKEESRKPLEGISFTRDLLEETHLSEDQRKLLVTNAWCERQLRKILDDDVNNIEEGYKSSRHLLVKLSNYF